MPGSRIAVEILGQSGELQKASAAAADALKSLGDVLKRQTDSALALGDSTIRSNSLVSRSYQEAAREAGLASDRTIAAFDRQGAVALSSARKQTAALEETATVARQSSGAQVRASEQAAAASTRAADTHVRAARRTEQAFGSSSSSVTRAGKMISLGLVGAAAASLDLAVKFQANTLRMQTQAGATAQQLDLIRQGLLRMAPQVGYTPNKLADGMYHVVSSMTAAQRATYGVAGELKVMRTAAQLAQVGHSHLEDTTYALVSALQALHEPLQNVGHVAGQVNAIVGAGDMTMTDFVEALKSGLLPAAKVAGISLQSVGAAMAAMGDQGMRGSLAGTRLRMSIALLSSPSAAAAKVLDTLGLSAKEATSRSAAMAAALEKAGLRTTSLSADLRRPDGIAYALTDLRDHLEKAGMTATGAAAVMNKAFGGGRMGATITLLENNLGRVGSKFNQIGSSASQFGADWTRTTHTTAFELKAMEAQAAALGTRIGTDLLPAANTAIHDFSEFVGWLEKGTVAAHAFELGVGAIAAVAVGSFFTSQLKKATTLLRDLGAATRFTGTLAATGSVSQARTSALPSSTLAGVGRIFGAKGPEAPGSVANPIVVAQIAGEYAGLSSMGAAGTVGTEEKVAQAESGAVSTAAKDAGMVAPARLTGAGSAEAAAATAGIVGAERSTTASILGSLKGALGGLMKGGLIAGGGIAASQLAGQMIHGKVGATISHVGTDASIGGGAGAAIGSIVPGVGTVVGGLTGALGGAIIGGLTEYFKNPSYGQRIAGALTKGFGGAHADTLNKQVASALDQLHQYETKTTQTAGPRGQRIDVPVHLNITQLDPTKQAAAMAAANRAGTLIAKQLEAGWSQYRFQSEPIMFSQLRSEIAKLPPEAQGGAIKSALAFAQGLVRQGRLPANAMATMLAQVKQQFPGFEKYMGITAMAGSKEFTKALDLSKAETNVKTALNSMRGDFPQVVHAMDTTSGDVQHKSAAVVTALQGIVAHGTKPMRAQAQQDLDRLRQTTSSDLTAASSLVVQKTSDMASAVKHNLGNAAQSAYVNLGNFASNVTQAMSSGTEATGKGMSLIVSTLNKALKEMGQKTLTPLQVGAMTLNVGKQAQLTRLGAATGGWVGGPGEKGRDAVPAMLGRGEAVLNHQQQAVVNTYVPGGLPAVFSATTGTRHYMAAGGFAGGGMVGGNVWEVRASQEASSSGGGWTELSPNGNAAAFLHIPRSFSNNPGHYPDFASLGRFFPNGTLPLKIRGPHGSGTWNKTDSGDGSSFAPAIGLTPAVSSVTGGTGGTVQITRADGGDLHLFPGMGRLVSGSGGFAAAGPGGGVAPTTIAVPKVTGTGTIADLVRATLGKGTKAANAYLQQHTPAATTGGGGAGGPVNTAIAPTGSKPAVVQQDMFAAADHINGRPYVWGGGHGAWEASGYDCSGAVSYILHAGGFLNSPEATGALASWGAPGPGKYITVGVSNGGPGGGHTMMDMFGRYFESGGGPLGPHWDHGWSQGFQVYRHPPGYATGGIVATGGDFGQVPPSVLLKRTPGLANLPEFTKYAAAKGYEFAAGGRLPHALRAAKVTKPPKPKTLKPKKLGKSPKAPGTNLSAKDMQVLADVGGKVNSIEGVIAQLTGRYQASQTLFAPQEAMAQYLNADGSLNAAGYAKKVGDDKTLLGIDTQLKSLYGQEAPIVSHALKKWLGNQGATNSKIARNKAKVAQNKLKEDSIRKAILDLSKPGKNTVKTIEQQIAQVRHGWEGNILAAERAKLSYDEAAVPREVALEQAVINAQRRKLGSSALARADGLKRAVLSAEAAEHGYGGKNHSIKQGLSTRVNQARQNYSEFLLSQAPVKAQLAAGARGAALNLRQYLLSEKPTRQQLTDSLANARLSEQAALYPLEGALLAARSQQQQRAQRVKIERFHLRQQLAGLTRDDLKLGQADTTLSGILTGANGGDSTNQTVNVLETVAGKLGMIRWGAGGNFAGLDLSMPGEMVNVTADMQSLRNDIAQTTSAQSTATSAASTTDTTQLDSILQQQNLQLSEALALNEAQTRVLAGMIPEIPRYEKGGPVLDDGLIYAHAGEHVVPKGGTLVTHGGGATTVELHQHLHGDMAGLANFIDQRISHPDNVRAVSSSIGRRTSMLAGAPGGFRR